MGDGLAKSSRGASISDSHPEGPTGVQPATKGSSRNVADAEAAVIDAFTMVATAAAATGRS